jgi:hypothetical protein
LKARDSLDQEVSAIRAKIVAVLASTADSPLSPSERRKIDRQARSLIVELESLLGRIDPVSMPPALFDPSNPKIIGRFTALALVAQAKRPLAEIGRFYGSGVYALYYSGAFPIYAGLSGSETPIYVGKAGPATQGAQTARDQGERLAARLNDHRKNIAKATTTLDLNDFQARFLVVQSGWETAAEDYLIHLFRPIWNSEINILYGLGKHGDSAAIRANKRSPWDTLHPGRSWAADTIEDARSIARIEGEVVSHFERHAPYRDRASLLDSFFSELRQI